MQFTKLVLSLLALQQCDASGAIAGKTVGAVVGGAADIAVSLNPGAAAAVAVTSVLGVVYKYQG